MRSYDPIMAKGGTGSQDARPWEGSQLCRGRNHATGQPCSNFEILGLEYCLHHVPPEMLDEAEEITGFRRCRTVMADGATCGFYAVKGTDPPACKNHGANIGSVTSREASRRVAEQRAIERMEEILSQDGERLLNPPRLEDPLAELLLLAAEVKAFKEIMRVVVSAMTLTSYRYSGTRTGEQIRAELLLYERGLERLATLLVQISKLKIDERMAQIEERQMAAIERALGMALQASGADLAGQARARTVLIRELAAKN
jgi:hypothetical protein